MSTLFVADKDISFGALRTFDADGVSASLRGGDLVLSDGKNCMWVYPASEDSPVTFERCGSNDPTKIIAAVEKVFGVRLVSEYE